MDILRHRSTGEEITTQGNLEGDVMITQEIVKKTQDRIVEIEGHIAWVTKHHKTLTDSNVGTIWDKELKINLEYLEKVKKEKPEYLI